jgi:hypothetical protein
MHAHWLDRDWHCACLSAVSMSEPRQLRCYQYVDRPYTKVRALLHARALELLEHASSSAAARARSLTTTLRVAVAGIEIGVDVRPRLDRVREEDGVAGMSPVTFVDLTWEAARTPGLFPAMQAVLSAWPLSATETQLEIEGRYRLPLGTVGKAIDAAVMHRVAEASVHRLLEDLVEQIRREAPAEA